MLNESLIVCKFGKSFRRNDICLKRTQSARSGWSIPVDLPFVSALNNLSNVCIYNVNKDWSWDIQKDDREWLPVCECQEIIYTITSYSGVYERNAKKHNGDQINQVEVKHVENSVAQ